MAVSEAYERLRRWITDQRRFLVATAPAASIDKCPRVRKELMMSGEEAAEIARSLPTAGSRDLTPAGRQAGVVGVVPAASFGTLLRAHRERALLSQEELAQRAGLSARTIRELEAGRVRRPRGSSVRLLTRALGLDGSRRQAFEAAARHQLSGRAGLGPLGLPEHGWR